MIKALDTAATGMASQEANVNTISNNLANVNTTGFKKGRTEFSDLLYQTVQESGARSSENSNYAVGHQIGSGSKVESVRKIHSQGNPKVTNNPYDLMINGDGLFGVVDGQGRLFFTRDGKFSVSQGGDLVTTDGMKVFPGLTIPPNTKSLNISEDGNVDAYLANQPEPIQLGQIPVFQFINPAGLSSQGKNLYKQTSSSGLATQMVAGTDNIGIIQQGMLETSNVNIMQEMTDLIKAQRAFEMNSKVMGVADQILQTVNNIR